MLKRILRLAELPDDKKPDNLLMLSLRKFAPKIRLLIVEEAIGTIPDWGLVIIDGIRDFLYDINSSSEIHRHHLQIHAVDGRQANSYPYRPASEQE